MAIKIVVDTNVFVSALTSATGVSLNRLVDDLSSMALAQYDAEVRFQVLAGRGNATQGLRLLDKLDRAFAGKAGRNNTASFLR